MILATGSGRMIRRTDASSGTLVLFMSWGVGIAPFLSLAAGAGQLPNPNPIHSSPLGGCVCVGVGSPEFLDRWLVIGWFAIVGDGFIDYEHGFA